MKVKMKTQNPEKKRLTFSRTAAAAAAAWNKSYDIVRESVILRKQK